MSPVLASSFLYNHAGKELRAVEIELKSEAWIDPEMDLTSVSESFGLRKKKPITLHISYHKMDYKSSTFSKF